MESSPEAESLSSPPSLPAPPLPPPPGHRHDSLPRDQPSSGVAEAEQHHSSLNGSAAPPVDVGLPWSSSLYDCGLDETNGIMTAFFPCITFGQIAEILDEGQTSCALASFMYILLAPALCSCWLLGSTYRKKLRMKYNLVEAPADDWIAHLFCPCCSLCQEFSELKHKGIDPSQGWKGHLAQQQQAATAPPKSQSMAM